MSEVVFHLLMFGGIEMTPKEKQEKEVIKYVRSQWEASESTYFPSNWVIGETVRMIMRRYELFDTEDMPRED